MKKKLRIKGLIYKKHGGEQLMELPLNNGFWFLEGYNKSIIWNICSYLLKMIYLRVSLDYEKETESVRNVYFSQIFVCYVCKKIEENKICNKKLHNYFPTKSAMKW